MIHQILSLISLTKNNSHRVVFLIMADNDIFDVGVESRDLANLFLILS